MSTSRPELNTENKKEYTIEIEEGVKEVVSENIFKAIGKLTMNMDMQQFIISIQEQKIKNLESQLKKMGNPEVKSDLANKDDEMKDAGALLGLLAALSAARSGNENKPARKPSFSGLFSNSSSKSSDSEEEFDLADLLANSPRRP